VIPFGNVLGSDGAGPNGRTSGGSAPSASGNSNDAGGQFAAIGPTDNRAPVAPNADDADIFVPIDSESNGAGQNDDATAAAAAIGEPSSALCRLLAC